MATATGPGRCPGSVPEVLRAVVEEVVTDLLILDRLSAPPEDESCTDEGAVLYRRLRRDVVRAVSRALAVMVVRDIGGSRPGVAAAARCPLGRACVLCSPHRDRRAPGDSGAGSAGDRS